MALHKIRKDTKEYCSGWSGGFYCITIISMHDGKKHTCQNVSKDGAIGQVYAKHRLYLETTYGVSRQMTNDQIRDIALANGFKLKEQPDGTMDLNPYVYGFARALISEYLLTHDFFELGAPPIEAQDD